jgi:hypothetical protein
MKTETGRMAMKTATRIAFFMLVAAALAPLGCGGGGGGKDAADDALDVPDAQDDRTDDGTPDVPDTPQETEQDTPADPAADDAPADPTVDDAPADPTVDDAPADPDAETDGTTPEERCIAAGGTVETMLCCLDTGDFPNLCTTGPCGCAPEYSHDVQVCACAEGCWNGAECWLE